MSIYRIPEFEKAVHEHFDLNDKETFSYLISVEEADQNKVLVALTSKLYDHLVDKINDIDFGDIPKTRGDIEKLPNYKNVLDCIQIIKDILINMHQDTEPVDTVSNTVKYLVQYKETFIRGYQLKMELPMVIYNTAVLSVYSGISILISSCIEFIKSTDGSGFEISVDKVQLKKTKDSLLFRDLKILNKSFENGDLPKALDAMLRQHSKQFTGTSIVLLGATMGVILNIIPILRELTYFFYYSRTKVADYFDAQSALLQMNAYNLVSRSSNDAKNIKDIQNKQLKIANGFKKISNFLSVQKNKAEVSTEKEGKALEKKLKISDIKTDDLSDDNGSLW